MEKLEFCVINMFVNKERTLKLGKTELNNFSSICIMDIFKDHCTEFRQTL